MIKISDLVSFSESDYIKTDELLKQMNIMVQEYVENLEDIEGLELLKRKFNGNLVYLGSFYSKIKCFKEQHEFLESHRKRIKSETIQHLIENSDEKMSVAAAEKLVYSCPYYIDRISVLEKLKKFFYKVELNYQNYQDCLRSIYQSISLLSKEKQSAT